MATSVFGPSVEAAKSLGTTPQSLVAPTAGLVSLFFRRPENVQIGPGLLEELPDDRLKVNDSATIVLTLDATLSETHRFRANITEHAVEDGPNISDHIRRTPTEIQIDGIVSRTPIKFLASSRVREDPVVSAYDTIDQIMTSGSVVDVFTALKPYKSMGITSSSIVRDARNGNILNVSLGLRQIRIVTSEEEEGPQLNAAEKVNNRTKNENTKSLGEVNQAQETKTKTTLLQSVGG